MLPVQIILLLLSLYLMLGLVFAIPFLAKWITEIDESAKGTKLGFRIIILPGTIVFWPYLWKKWRKNLKNKRNE